LCVSGCRHPRYHEDMFGINIGNHAAAVDIAKKHGIGWRCCTSRRSAAKLAGEMWPLCKLLSLPTASGLWPSLHDLCVTQLNTPPLLCICKGFIYVLESTTKLQTDKQAN
jgi:hypothetical protein